VPDIQNGIRYTGVFGEDDMEKSAFLGYVYSFCGWNLMYWIALKDLHLHRLAFPQDHSNGSYGSYGLLGTKTRELAA